MKKINEINLCNSSNSALTKICIAYPNSYNLAMSNLGFISIFYLLTSRPLASGERASLPLEKEISLLKKKGRQLKSIESGRPLKSFDILAFSVSFENDYVNAVKMLDLASIPVFSRERGENEPLVIAGGIALILNPEPVADIFDAILLGDSPEMASDFIDTYNKHKGSLKKADLLRELSKIKGVYVPSHYDVTYGDDGTVSTVSQKKGAKKKIDINMSEDLFAFPAYSYIISKEALFSDMFLIEISRGCSRFCRFCAAAYNYLPHKKLPLKKVKEIIREHSHNKKVGLVSAAVSDYKEIDALCDFLIKEGTSFSVSSFRADSLTDKLLTSLEKSGHKTLTIAPEAGSQRMRDIIKKGITKRDILSTAKRIAGFGILNIKLYYIIGLPFETDGDIKEIVSLTKEVRDIFLEASKKLKRAGRITVSMHPFVPKARTPFYFIGMDSEAGLKAKIKTVKDSLKKEPNIHLEQVSIRDARLEALISRGDRRVSHVIRLMAKGKSLKQAALSCGADIDFYVNRDVSVDEALPFDHVRSAMKKGALIRELKEAKKLAGL